MNKIEESPFTGKFYFERIAGSVKNKSVVEQTLEEKAGAQFATKVLQEIENPKISRSRILYCGEDPLGAIVFNSDITPEDKVLNIGKALCIRQIIVIGKGEKDQNLVYQKLIEKAVQKAQELKAQHLYLLADNDDHQAIHLCKNNGFTEMFLQNIDNSQQLLIKNFNQNPPKIARIDKTETENNNNLYGARSGFVNFKRGRHGQIQPHSNVLENRPKRKNRQNHDNLHTENNNNLYGARSGFVNFERGGHGQIEPHSNVLENRPKRKNREEHDNLQNEQVKRPKQESLKITNEFTSRQQQPSSKMHTCTLKKIYIDQILSGKKTVEGRINSGMFLKIKEGNSIKFFCGHGNFYREVICKVTKIEKFESFEEMLKKVGYQNCLPECTSLNQAASEYSKIPQYSKKASQYGVLALHIQKME